MALREIRFQAVIGADRVIHLPEGVMLEPGEVEVTLRIAEQVNGEAEASKSESWN